jgi:hypothetical protein
MAVSTGGGSCCEALPTGATHESALALYAASERLCSGVSASRSSVS